jgi:hypothetical protein
MNEQLERIQTKLQELKKLDTNFVLFGSKTHRYKLNAPISEETIKQFEIKHEINLPNDYVQFLTVLGNGGAGPFYGLEPIENALFNDLDYKTSHSLLNPSKPFPHIEPWNLAFRPTVDEEENEAEYEKQFAEFEERYYDKQHMSGVIAICNYGCGVSLNLVVNGQEYGNIWTDDRGNDNGIYASLELGNAEKIGFSNWYELWLDNSLAEIGSKLSAPKSTALETKEFTKENKKPWWKVW